MQIFFNFQPNVSKEWFWKNFSRVGFNLTPRSQGLRFSRIDTVRISYVFPTTENKNLCWMFKNPKPDTGNLTFSDNNQIPFMKNLKKMKGGVAKVRSACKIQQKYFCKFCKFCKFVIIQQIFWILTSRNRKLIKEEIKNADSKITFSCIQLWHWKGVFAKNER